MTNLPFLTAYDPPGASEGTLDPLGLYPIADQLAVSLVPAVRERMQRVRFLTAMAVGALVTADMEDAGDQRDASPYLVWEWLVVEAITRRLRGDSSEWGVPGSLVARRALAQHGYLDARSYLKTPRIFGFNGVYKRLAIHLGLVDVNLRPGPNAELLVDAWARGLGGKGLGDARPLLAKWSSAVRRSVEKPARTKVPWSGEEWAELAGAFLPSETRGREKRVLRDLLHGSDDRRLGALPHIWALQGEWSDDTFREERLHGRLVKRAPELKPLLEAIRSYEDFARHLQDAFDLMLAEAAQNDMQGYAISTVAGAAEFEGAVQGLDRRFREAHEALRGATLTGAALQSTFSERFQPFAEPMDAARCAATLCSHHVTVQAKKSAAGKRPWFEKIAEGRIHVRQAYRQPRRESRIGRYVHDYRGWPIRYFYRDLA